MCHDGECTNSINNICMALAASNTLQSPLEEPINDLITGNSDNSPPTLIDTYDSPPTLIDTDLPKHEIIL